MMKSRSYWPDNRKEQAAMPIAFNVNAVQEYTLKGDDSGTIFKLGLFDPFLRTDLETLLAKARNKWGLPLKLLTDEMIKAKATTEDPRYSETFRDLTQKFVDEQQKIPLTDEAQYFFSLVRFGLRGWDNFKDESGVPVPFVTEERVFPLAGKRTAISDESLKYFRSEWLIELGLEIHNRNYITGQALKN
jgi:hypothetical protein